jgi:4-hydroxybenzoyl-CoA reductase alpha subunit
MDNRNFSQVGRSVPRIDGAAKVKGEAIYTDDMVMPLMAFGKIKRSPYAHALIKKIDYSKALNLPGVLAIITGKDAPNKWGIVPQTATEVALAVEKVRFHGEGVAAVAAIDEETAESALDLIEVEYEPLPVLLDPFESMERAGEITIHEESPDNILHQAEQLFGDPDKAFADCTYILEKDFYTSYVNHAFLEPHSSLASYDPQSGQLQLWSSTQVPHYLHRQLSIVMEMPMSKIRVTLPAIGGGFGGKGEASSSDFCAALLSRKTGRPVRVTYERSEVFATNKGRHPCHMKMKIGLDRDGYIQAVDFNNTLDGGAYAGWGMVVMFYTASMIHLPYRVPNARARVRRVYTNKPTCGAMRGLGGVQPRFAMECLLDELAEIMGVSAYELKMKNAVESGYRSVSNLHVPHSEFKQCLQTVIEKSGYLEKHGKMPPGKGIGLAGGYYISGTAYTLYQAYKPHTTVLIRVDTEGGVTVHCAAADIGQGCNTVMAQMAAEALGLRYEDVHVVSGDTELGTFDLGSFASRVTYASGAAIKEAAGQINDKLFEVAAGMLGCRADQLEVKDQLFYSVFEPKKTIEWEKVVDVYTNAVGTLTGIGHFSPPRLKGIDLTRGERVQGANIGHSPTFGFSAQVIEVDVDTETGRVRVIKVTEAGDCGQAVNPMSVEGQVEGSIMFTLGQALYEEMILDENGKMINPSLHDYRVPTAMELPEIDSTIVDSYDPTAPFGVKESGEGPVQPTIPAITNAIYDAIGIRFTELPITPEKVLKALHEKNKKQ